MWYCVALAVAVATFGCGPRWEWKFIHPKKGELSQALVVVYDQTKDALGMAKVIPAKEMPEPELKKVWAGYVFYKTNFDLLFDDEEETALKERALLAREYLSQINSPIELEGAVLIPELGLVWADAQIEMSEVMQGLAGVTDIAREMMGDMENRMLCLIELSVRVYPEVTQGILDDYGESSEEGACKALCVSRAVFPAAAWCLAYPTSFGDNAEFVPDTLWEEIDEYLWDTCEEITAKNGCRY